MVKHKIHSKATCLIYYSFVMSDSHCYLFYLYNSLHVFLRCRSKSTQPLRAWPPQYPIILCLLHVAINTRNCALVILEALLGCRRSIASPVKTPKSAVIENGPLVAESRENASIMMSPVGVSRDSKFSCIWTHALFI